MKLLPKQLQKRLALRKEVSKGFTLIELLVVIGILADLLFIVLIAINPARQFAQANNTQRRSDVGAILNAIHQYAADNKGDLPTGTPDQGNTADVSFSGTCEEFCSALVPAYIAGLPKDPSSGSYTDCNSYDTNYTVAVATASSGSTPRITIAAPDAELGISISVTR